MCIRDRIVAWSVLSTLAFTGFQFAFDSGMVPGAGAVAAGEVPADLLTVMAENEFTKVLLDIDWVLMVISTVVFFVGGYLLYGSLYAVVGSTVQSEQEGQGMVFPLTMPLMFAYVFGIQAMENPDMAAFSWLSWFPLTSPVIMLIRVAVGVPFWELGLSVLLLFLTARLVLWVAGRAYRHGVLAGDSASGWALLLQWVRGHGR